MLTGVESSIYAYHLGDVFRPPSSAHPLLHERHSQLLVPKANTQTFRNLCLLQLQAHRPFSLDPYLIHRAEPEPAPLTKIPLPPGLQRPNDETGCNPAHDKGSDHGAPLAAYQVLEAIVMKPEISVECAELVEE